MATPFDIANFNLVNFAYSYNAIFDSTPADVAIDVKDSNGNITTKTVANRGKFKQQIWDDVGSAIGQFSRNVYVDAVNGSDLNTGAIDSPYKTLTKAISSTPVGGKVHIYLQSDVELANEVIIGYEGKNVAIDLNGFTLSKTNTINRLTSQNHASFLKIMNGTISIQVTDTTITNESAQYLVTAVDTMTTVVLGDFDSNLVVDINLVNALGGDVRGVVKGHRSALFGTVQKTTATCNLDIPYYLYAAEASHAVYVSSEHSAVNLTNVDISNSLLDPIEFIKQNSTRNFTRSRIFYIDPINGNDRYIGVLETKPIKTVDRLFKLASTVKYAYIYLMGDIEIDAFTGSQQTQFIEFRPHANTPEATVTINKNDAVRVFTFGQWKTLRFVCNTTFINTVDTIARPTINLLEGAFLQFGKNITTGSNAKLTIGDNAKICWNRNANIRIDGSDIILGSNSSFTQISDTARISVYYGNCNLSTDGGATFNALTEADVIAYTAGIIKDANGIPRNVISNIKY